MCEPCAVCKDGWIPKGKTTCPNCGWDMKKLTWYGPWGFILARLEYISRKKAQAKAPEERTDEERQLLKMVEEER